MFKLIKIARNYVLRLLDQEMYYTRKSYSQEGEDLILANCFGSKEKGFYVDVGAYHPFRFSNTYLFYKKGWNGINIDATPGSMVLFNKYRQRDINLEAAISNKKQRIHYFIFDETGINSFSSKLSMKRESQTKYKIQKIVTLKTKKLSELLDKYVPSGQKIDFMSIDVEGLEYEVLRSNNWNKYKPTYLLVEILRTKFSALTKNKINIYLKNINYSIVSVTERTVIFKLN